MSFRAGKLRMAVERGPSTAGNPGGPQDKVVTVGVVKLGDYLEGRLREIPCQFLLFRGSGVHCP